MLLVLLLGSLTGCSSGAIQQTIESFKESAGQIQEENFPERRITEEEKELYYGYSGLSEEDREVYRQIAAGIEGFREEIPVTPVPAEDLEKIMKLVMTDHPEYFWTDGTCTFSYRELPSGETEDMSVRPQYQVGKEEAEDLKKQIEQKADAWISQIPADADTYEKIKSVYETLIHQVHYRQDSPQNQNIRSVFLEGSTVCMGYAKATQYLLNRMGIFCTLVTGTAGETQESHAWNLVKEGESYYYVDTTWGNPGYRNPEEEDTYISYSYLCCSDRELKDTHQADDLLVLPACTDERYHYYEQKGRFYETFDRETIYQTIAAELSAGAAQTELKFATQEAYDQAIDALVKGSLIENAIQNSDALVPGAAYSWKTCYGTSDFLIVILWE